MRRWLAGLTCAMLLASFGAPAAIAFVAAHSASKVTGCGTLGASCVLTLGFTAASGNDLFVGVGMDSGCTINTVTDSSGTNTYTLKGVVTTNATCGEKNQIYSSHLGANATTVTVAFTGSCNSQFTLITGTEYSGVATTGNTSAGATGNGTTVTDSVTLQNAANVTFGGFTSCAQGITFTAVTGTLRANASDITNGTICSIDNNAGNTVTATTGTQQWAANAVELCATNPCAGTSTAVPLRSLMGVGQ